MQDNDIKIPDLTIRFAGDSGDGMQLTGTQFSFASAEYGTDLSTLADYPAEIRAPRGSLYGVSGFQIQIGSHDIHYPGDKCDILVVMNPAALKVSLKHLAPGKIILVNTDTFTERNLSLAKYDSNPLEDDSLKGYELITVPMTRLVKEALKDSELGNEDVERSKNFLALGLTFWLADMQLDTSIRWIKKKFKKKALIESANITALKTGYNYGETAEIFSGRPQFKVSPHSSLPKGTYRSINGNQAIAYGLVAASENSGLPIFYGSYPITPASDILHHLSGFKHHGVVTFQAEDEIAAMCSIIGASFGGALGVTGTSGPGMALKTEAISYAIAMEMPVVIVNIQRGGPSTGLPTKTEQSDLLQAVYGRHGDADVVVLSCSNPSECFTMAYEASRIAVKYMTPVILLSDGYIANASEPWLIPDLDKLKAFEFNVAKDPDNFLPYSHAPKTLARPWMKAGTPGFGHRIGGIERQEGTGLISYDPINHERMTHIRADKIKAVQADIPLLQVNGPEKGDLLILGWGGSFGATKHAVDSLRAKNIKVSAAQLNYISPFPSNLGEILNNFDKVLIPELNNGQLARIIQSEFVKPVIKLNKIQGSLLSSTEVEDKVMEIINK